MESVPSFSIGLTQFDVNPQTPGVVGFVPRNFDMNNINFHENRSKHRNDLAMMKKLREVAGISNKNPVVAASKRKIIAQTSRDPLPQGMNYVVKDIPPHPLHFGSSCTRKFLDDFKNFLDEEVVELFVQTCFRGITQDA